MPNYVLEATTKIVIDTNVLVSALLFGQRAGQVYLHCVERYAVYTTEWIISEAEDVISRPKFRLPKQLQSDILSQIRSDFQILDPTDSSDPDDNNVLRATLFINADFLITGDEKHLLPLKRVGDTEIISPRAFYDQYMA